MADKAIDILLEAKKQGINVLLKEDQLQLQVPSGQSVANELLKSIKTHKEKIIRHLQQEKTQALHTGDQEKKIPSLSKDLEKVPLSFNQERLWLIDRVEGSLQYHIPQILRIQGAINIEALQQALRCIVNRHEILRTVIREEMGKPHQYVLAQDKWQLFRLQAPSANQGGWLKNKTHELITMPFDLSRDHMIRAHLITLDGNESVLVMTLHHIASDGWSVHIFVKELVELYEACSSGRNPLLKAPVIQYADYAIWQRHYLSEVMAERLQYWISKLDGITPLNIPTDYVRPAIQSTRGGSIRFEFERPLTKHLNQFSQSHDVTLYMTMLAAFNVLLYHYSGQEDICVGSPIAGRQQQETEGLIGFFVNTLVLRTTVSPGVSFTGLLEQVREVTLGAYEHQDVPFDKIVSLIYKERDVSRSPLFQIEFILQNTPRAIELTLGDALVHGIPFDKITAKFDLSFSIEETATGVFANIEYCSDLFKESTIRQMAVHYQQILKAVVQNPAVVVSDLEFLTEKEINQLLFEFNDTARNYPLHKTLVDLLEAQALQTPSATAIVFQDQRLTFKEFNERSNQLAHYLHKKGVREETLVPICIDRSIEMILGIVAILKAGGAYVPVDPGYPQERILYIIKDTNATLCLCNAASETRVKGIFQIEVIKIDTEWKEISKQSHERVSASLTSGNLAYVIYTSGSTGKPKGVMVEHSGIVNRLIWAQEYFQLTSADAVLQKTTFCFDVSVWELLWPLMVGSKLVFAKPEGHKDSVYLKQIVDEEKITILHFVPSMLEVFLQDLHSGECSALRKVLCSGEALKVSHVNLFKEKLPHVQLYNLYGPTEASVDVTYWSAGNKDNEITIVPIGKPVANTYLYVLSPQNKLLPVGVWGELCIGGVQLARGYLNQPALTAQRFVEDPLRREQHVKIYRTGDIVRWLQDGNIEYQGRMDHQVKIRGFRIELGEIESVLDTLPMITTSCVVANEQAEIKRLLAYYVPDGNLITEKEIDLYHKRIENWTEVYENQYESEAPDYEFNIAGWNDSFTGNAISDNDMQLWLDDITNTILSHKPCHVLEIGCGTGLLYYRLAAHVQKYFGTDISQRAIHRLETSLNSNKKYPPASFKVCAAHNTALEPDAGIDTVILNSVVQYFPGEKYLSEVLAKSISLLKGSGVIILGDIRDYRLLRSFKHRVNISRTPENTDIKEFVWRTEQDVWRENELCLSPDYFYDLRLRYPEITHVDIQWKQGKCVNELFLYRYTVIIHVGTRKPVVKPVWEIWRAASGLKTITAQINKGNDVIAIRDVENPRLWREVIIDDVLKNKSIKTVSDLSQRINAGNHHHEVENILTLAHINGYNTRLLLHDDPFKINILLIRKKLDIFVENFKDPDKVLYRQNAYNTPLLYDICVYFRKHIHQAVKSILPDYMVPWDFIAVRSLPITHNGKVDRKFLSLQHKQDNDHRTQQEPTSALQSQLVLIWKELLGLSQVGIQSNFFELGGDSIVSIQVVSRMRRLGYDMQPKDIFYHQTIEKLSSALLHRQNPIVKGEQGYLSGQSSLLPIQQWYLEKELQNHHHFNQSILLSVDKTVEPGTLHRVAKALIQYHDSFRLQVVFSDNGWTQIYGALDGGITVVDLREMPDRWKEELEERCNEFQKSLNLDNGPLVQIVHFLIPLAESANRILVVVHHLAMDGVSWRILLEDFELLIRLSRENKDLHLGTKRSSYREWAAVLEEYSKSNRLLTQRAFWGEIARQYKPLPVQKGHGRLATANDIQHVVFDLSKQLTQKLLREVSKAYHTEINDILLCALARTLSRWSGSDEIFIGLEGHGREDSLFANVDTTRTIGWFTNIYPVRLDITGLESHGDSIKSVKEQLRSIPDKGLGYGVLKYINREKNLQGKDHWDIIFNYLGQLDNIINESEFFAPASEQTGQHIFPGNTTHEKFLVNCSVVDSKLLVEWSYSSVHYEKESIESLGRQFLSDITSLITHCEEASRRGSVFTPADYGLNADITYQELDSFLETTHNGAPLKAEIENLCRLSGLQEGMIFHGLYDQAAGNYVEQFCFDILNLNEEVFLKSWSYLIKRHSILRTAFYHDAFDVSVQCVHKSVELPVQFVDYSTSGTDEIVNKINNFMKEDRLKGFDFTKAPLMRLTIIKLDETRHQVLWTHHHAILDGWSTAVIFNELLYTYEQLSTNTGLSDVPEDRYEDYIRYIEARDKEQEEKHWRKYLNEVKLGSSLPFLNHGTELNKGIGHYEEVYLQVDGEVTTNVLNYAQRHRITINTMMQAVWAYLLYRYAGQSSVIYGTVVSGRPDKLADSEHRVGLYINTLPVKIMVNENDRIIDWLKSIQEEQIVSREYQHSALTDIRKWCGIHGDLFDNVLVFENYPVDKAMTQKSWKLKVENVRMEEQTNYPLSILINAHGNISIRFCYNADALDKFYVNLIKDHFHQVLAELVSNDRKKTGDIELLIPTEKYQLTSVFNNTQRNYPIEKDLLTLFEEQVENTPDKVAVYFDHDAWTYNELNQHANQLGRLLVESGVRPQDIVPVCADRSVAMVVGILGVLKAGGAYVPVDAGYPSDRIAFLLRDTGADIVLAFSGIDLPPSEEKEYRRINIDNNAAYNRFSKDNLNIKVRPDDLACLIYTSGSSGKPKGVRILYGAILNRLHWMWEMYPFESNEKCAWKTSIGFVDHIWEIFGPLVKGVPSLLFQRQDVIDIDVFIKKLADHQVTRLVLVPSLLTSVLHKVETDGISLRNLRYWTCSGEILTNLLINNFYLLFPVQSHKLLNIYGSTEVMADVTCHDTSAELLNKLQSNNTTSLLEITVRNEIEDLMEEFLTRSEIIQPDKSASVKAHYNDVSIKDPLTPAQYIEFLRNDLLPGIVNVSKPGYVGHMTGVIPQFVKDFSALMVGLNQNLVKIETSYAASAIERQVLGIVHRQAYKFREAFYDEHTQNPESCLGVITNGGTLSNITALSFALRKVFAPEGDFKGIAEEGLVNSMSRYNYRGITVIGSNLVHYSINKALQILGLGKSSYTVFEFNKNNTVKSAEELKERIESFQKDKILVLAIVGVAGSTETGRVDPLIHLGKIAAAYGIHFHVDGAFGGAYIFSSQLGHKLKGIDYADSVTICGHKQMLLPMGASLCLFKEPHFASYSENNTYYQARKGSYDLGRYTIEGSRSFISLLFHCTLKILGVEKLSAMIEGNYNKTLRFAEMIRTNEHFQLMEDPELNIIIYRYIPVSLRNKCKEGSLSARELMLINEINRKLQKVQFLRGKSFVSYTEIAGPQMPESERLVVLRIVVMNPYTTEVIFKEVLFEQIQIAEEIVEGLYSEPGMDTGVPTIQVAIPRKANFRSVIGKPIANTRAYILNSKHKLCPVGVPGELCIAGAQVAQGYHNLPELTKEKFIPEPFLSAYLPSQRMYRTGDIAKWLPDGTIEFLGRVDDQVKIRGQRVELGEIENVLLQNEMVRKAVVVARENKNGNKRLIAYIISNGTFEENAIITYARKKLPEYMIPLFIEVREFPLTGSGKIDKKSLPDPDSHAITKRDHLAPRNGKELKLLNIWRDLLQVEHIGVTDNFFDLGGHSLLVTRVISAIRREFKVEVAIRDLFTNPTIEQLTSILTAKSKNNTRLQFTHDKPAHLPLSFSQERLWVIDQLEGSTQYHVPIVFKLDGKIDRRALEMSIQSIIDRHQVLKTIILSDEDGRPYQHIRGEIKFRVTLAEMKELASDSIALHNYLQVLTGKPFNLSVDIPLRADLITLEEHASILVITLHHIASDGWSVPIFFKELVSFYRYYTEKQPVTLSSLPLQYADYALWQRTHLQQTVLNHKLIYWKDQLRKIKPVNLPLDYTRPQIQSLRGARLCFDIDPEKVEKLRSISVNHEATLYMTLLSIFKVLIYRYTGQEDICVGSPIAGRQYTEFEDLIGYFVNTIAIRNHVTGSMPFAVLLKNVRETTLMAYEHQEVPFEKIVDATVHERSMDRTPIFQVFFDLQQAPDIQQHAQLPHLNISHVNVEHSTAKFDLAFSLKEFGTSIELNIEYCTDLFSEASIRNMADHYRQIIRDVSNNSDVPIDELMLSQPVYTGVNNISIDHSKLFDF